MGKAQIAEWKITMCLKIAQDKGLSPTAVRIAIYLVTTMNPGETRSVSIVELQEALDISSKGAVSDTMKLLEQTGYIKRMKSSEDKRERVVQLLAKTLAA
jgi:DNA-binding MarR family transcriptional regulator